MPTNTFETHREEVVAALIEAMEKGTAPWQKPWTGREEDRLPFNPTTDKEYRGGNSLWLQLYGAKMGYADPRWMTYKQAQQKGWQVRKGEKGTHIEKWEYFREMKETSSEGKEEKVSVKLNHPRVYIATVFNASQIEGVPALERDKPVVSFEWNPIDKADEILRNSGARIFNDQLDKAFYNRTRDEIHLPARDQFKDAAGYYGTALHELGHWTGHSSRLDRKFGEEFGSADYAREELRAELASYFLASRLGIPNDPTQNAAYLKHWIQSLKDDPKELYAASRDAEAISNLVMSYQNEKAKRIEQEAPATVGPEIVAARAITAPLDVIGTSAEHQLASHARWLARLQSHATENDTTYLNEQWSRLSQDIRQKVPDPPRTRLAGWLHKAKELADRQAQPEKFKDDLPLRTAWGWLATGLDTSLSSSDNARAQLAENQARGATSPWVVETREKAADMTSTLLIQTDAFRQMAVAVENGQQELTTNDRRDMELLMDTLYGSGYGGNLLRQYTAPIETAEGRIVKNLNNTFELEIEKRYKDDAPSFHLRPFPGKAAEAARVLNDTAANAHQQAQVELNRPAIVPTPSKAREMQVSGIQR